jgi:L-threonylcarbamoyladenylate synthase
MYVLRVDAKNPDNTAIRAAADAIRRGELVVFPTETVYGLAANALDESAVRRVFTAKGRTQTHPLPVQIAGVELLWTVASPVPESARLLAARFWPGPLTLILNKRDCVSDLVSGSLETVGVRVPNHAAALALLRELASPIVATSANLTGQEPPKTAQQAIEQLGDIISVVLDAGPSEIGVASTIVDVTYDRPRILRVGAIKPEQIVEVIGAVDINV